MRAIEILGGFGLDHLKLVDRPDPAPGPGQVVVAMKAASLNYRDLLVATGKYNPKMPLPRIPCSDGAGVVEAVGEGVSTVKVGDRVASTFFQGWVSGGYNEAVGKTALGGAIDGVLAERVVLEADGVVPIPGDLSFEEATTLPCAALTAWHGLVESGHVKAGESVLVQGTGGVSLFALQFARLHGARVIVTSSSDEKLRKAMTMGASDGVNYKDTPDWDKRVVELTGGVGVDHVVEVGGSGTLGRSVQAVRAGGHIALIGVLTQGDFDTRPLLMRSIRLQGIYVGSRTMFEAMNRAIALHGVRPTIDRVFPMEQAADALGYLESAGHFGKVVVRIG